MAIIKWKECYETKNACLDSEHRRLVEQINRLFEAMKEHRTEAVMLSIFDELVGYTEQHFKHEEELLETYQYPDLMIHQEQHQKLTREVCAYRSQLEAGEQLSAGEVMKFLRGWLLGHIVESDLKYGAYLESRGGRFIS